MYVCVVYVCEGHVMYTIIKVGRKVRSYTWFDQLFSPFCDVSPVFRLSRAVRGKWSSATGAVVGLINRLNHHSVVLHSSHMTKESFC